MGNIGTTKEIHQDLIKMWVEYRIAIRATEAISSTRGNAFLSQVAQDTADRGGELWGAVPSDDRPVLQRCCSGVRLPNGALAAYASGHGIWAAEIIAWGSVYVSDLFNGMKAHPEANAILRRANLPHIGAGVGGLGRYSAYVALIGAEGSEDRSGVTEDQAEFIPSCWNPENVFTLPGSTVQVLVRY